MSVVPDEAARRRRGRRRGRARRVVRRGRRRGHARHGARRRDDRQGDGRDLVAGHRRRHRARTASRATCSPSAPSSSASRPAAARRADDSRTVDERPAARSPASNEPDCSSATADHRRPRTAGADRRPADPQLRRVAAADCRAGGPGTGAVARDRSGARSRARGPTGASCTPTSIALSPDDRARGRRRAADSTREAQTEPVRGVRRRIAERLTAAWTEIPHITYVDAVDATELERSAPS